MNTIKDIARRAGVSTATVSHVINETRFVSPELRERVLTAVAELDYRPNAVARGLRQKKTRTIGLVVPDNSNPFFAEVAKGVEDAGYVKLREISAQYTWENARVRNFTGFTAIEFRLAARNLSTWTDYSGVDPETNLEGSYGIGRGQDYFNNPQTRSLIFSINLTH